MLKNHFLTAWRSLRRNKLVSAINVLGLSIGVAACLLISLYIIHEISYDKFVPDNERIFRLYQPFVLDGELKSGAHFSANTAPTIANDFPEVEATGRFMDNALFYGAGSNNISFGENHTQYREEGFSYADQSVVEILQIPMVEGDLHSALADPGTVVISKSKADKYFPNESVLGKTMYLNNNYDEPFRISAVMQDLPSNSHLNYDFLLTLTDVEFGEGEQTRWLQSNYFTYLKLKPEIDPASFSDKLTSHIFSTYIIPALEEGGYSGFIERLNDSSLELQPLNNIHLYSKGIMDTYTRGDIRFIWIFGIIAIFILLIACINFINLATARATLRAKEVGLRKVLGSERKSLVIQFLLESILLAGIATTIGLILSICLLPIFNSMAAKSLTMPVQSIYFWSTLLLGVIFVGCLAGLYPAAYIAGFKPIKALKGQINKKGQMASLRSSLVVFQFAASIILIVGTFVVYKQLNYILHKDLGFEKSHVIQLHSTDILEDKIQVFKDEIKSLPGVLNATISDYLPLSGTKRNGNTFFNEGKVDIDEGVPGQSWLVDKDYLETLNISLIAGRNFADDRGDEAQSVIINQAMAKALNLNDPLNKIIDRTFAQNTIIGVIEDFHFELLNEKVRPLALFYDTSPTMMSLKIKSDNIDQTLNDVEKKWNQMGATLSLQYTFMDESFAQMYDHIKRIGKIFTSFSILAILIACLGLFALSAFVVEQRQKEMSIRKVLGASLEGIFILLTRQFIALVLLSMLIALPLAFYFMNSWLHDFAYRTEISWRIFAISSVLALLIGLSTITYHAIRAALVNPVKILRDE